jgi:hypothetical protein
LCYKKKDKIKTKTKMDRRKAMKVAAGVLAGSGAGLFTLSRAFKAQGIQDTGPHSLEYTRPESSWNYAGFNPEVTAGLAYTYYNEGSCMYATIKSFVSQLAEQHGEPFASFPYQMFRYGHGGIGGYGSVCGALNGAAAVIGLFVTDKNVQDKMITDLFQWYEKAALPAYKPLQPNLDFTPVSSVSNSVLCHASNTNWCKLSGFGIDSGERKERCRRLTSDVVQKLTVSLNEIHSGIYMTNMHGNEAAGTCISCHGNDGKLKNTSVKMSCNSCHTESVGHKVFADVHYKLMK